MSELTLKEMAKLAKIKLTDLATQMDLEYGQVSTAVSMDEKGEEPKRRSVRERQALIREYLETMLKIEQRDGADDTNPKRKAGLWDSISEAERRFPAPRGCAQAHEMDGYTFGQWVRLDLDFDGAPKLYRFLRVVTNTKTGRQHVDVIGGLNGAIRSLTIDELKKGKRDGH